MDAMNSTELHFVRGKETFCLFPKTFNWFNTTEWIPLRQVKTYSDIEKKSCSDNCTCKDPETRFTTGKTTNFCGNGGLFWETDD